MAIWCRCFISVLISVLDIFSFSTSLFGYLWIAPLASLAMVMRGLTCQPVVLSMCRSGLYLVVFSLRVVFENLSWE